MHSLDVIHEYVQTVCQQIRWKKAHSLIAEEMRNHITDGRDAYIKQGHDEITATQQSITDCGDALLIGTQLDRIHRPKPQWGMMLWVVGFVLLGIVLGRVLFPGMDFSYGGLLIEMAWLVIGAVFMCAAYFADFSMLAKYPWRIFITVSLLAMAVFFYVTRHGDWVRVPYMGVITFRYITLLFPVLLVPAIYAGKNKGCFGLITAMLAYGFLCLVAVAAPPSGVSGFAHFMPVGLGLLVFAAARGWFGVSKGRGVLVLVVVLLHVAGFALWLGANIQSSGSRIFHRIVTSFNPGLEPYTRGFEPLQIRRLLSNATLLGEGTPDYSYDWFWPMRDMPQTLYEEYLLAAVTFRFGWLAFAAVMFVIVFFIVQIAIRCSKQKSGLGFMVSIAVVMTFAMQVLTFTISNMGFGIVRTSLPLISSGSAALVANMALLGFMLSVFRTGDAVADKYIDPSAKRKSPFTWQDGKLTIDFKLSAK